MSKRVPTGKFVMTIIGAHLTGRIPRWVDDAEVTCRTPREVKDVEHYARIADLTVKWKREGPLQVATLSFWPDMEDETPHASPVEYPPQTRPPPIELCLFHRASPDSAAAK